VSLASVLCGNACDRDCGLIHCQCVCCPLADAGRHALILYCVLIPVAFNMVYFWHECFSHFDWSSSVVLVDFLVHGAHYSHAGQTAPTVRTKCLTIFAI
jgi:hypothetical protein